MPAQPLAAFDAAACDAWGNPTRPALVSARLSVVGFVSVQFVRAVSRPASPTIAHGWDGIEGGCHHHAVVPVGPTQAEAERCTARVGDEVALRARLAPVRRVRAGGRAPFLAGTAALSRLARLQSISPARAGAPRAPDAGGPTRRPPASRAGAASNSSRSRSPSPLAASPRECLSAARTECRSTRLGSRSAVGHLLDVGGAAAEAAQSRSRDHRAEADEPLRSTPTRPIRALSVSALNHHEGSISRPYANKQSRYYRG